MASKLGCKYVNFVENNQLKIGQVESFARILSYLVPGSSQVVSELLYSSANLLVFVNDTILRRKYDIELPVAEQKLSNWVTVLEYTEVFLEITANQIGGPPGGWIAVFVVQFAKAFLRLVLLLYHESGIQSSPLIPPLNRRRLMKKRENTVEQSTDIKDDDDEDDEADEEDETKARQSIQADKTFTLRHSKRKMRCLNATPSLEHRGWSLPKEDHPASLSIQCTPLDNKMLAAESLHILRPLMHMMSLRRNNADSWKPWLVAIMMDVLNLFLLGDVKKYTLAERKEIQRRGTVMLLYLLRSPFYDRYTKTRLLSFLQFLTDNVPLIRIITGPLRDYIPYWQKIYGYVWMI